jgi:hypothetical protein
MGSGELGVSEAPATAGSFHSIGPGGLPLKKKVMPKASPKKLSANKNWKKSFSKFGSKISGGKRGS